MEIDDQLAPPGYYEPESIHQPPYRRWEDAEPRFDAWRWYVTDPEADPDVVAAITTHQARHLHCGCSFWVPTMVPFPGEVGVCARCEVTLFRGDGRSASDDLDDPVMTAMWRYWQVTFGWDADSDGDVFVCGGCWADIAEVS